MRSWIKEKDRIISVNQCWTQTLKIFVYFVNLLAVLFSCNDFIRIQEVVIKPAIKLSPWLSFGETLALGSVMELRRGLLSRSSMIVINNPFFIICYNSFEKWIIFIAQEKSRRHFKTTIFLMFVYFVPIYSVFLFFQFSVDGYRLLYTLHPIQKQILK